MKNPSRRVWIYVFAIVGIVLFLLLDLPVLYINTSASLPRGVYIRTAAEEKLALGDYVVYQPPEHVAAIVRAHGWVAPDAHMVPFLKRVGALPGDSYEVLGGRFSVRHRYIGDVLERDGAGQPIAAVSGAHIVPDGTFLPVADDPHGFDGRYTGVVSQDCIVAKVIPLLTEGGRNDQN